ESDAYLRRRHAAQERRERRDRLRGELRLEKSPARCSGPGAALLTATAYFVQSASCCHSLPTACCSYSVRPASAAALGTLRPLGTLDAVGTVDALGTLEAVGTIHPVGSFGSRQPVAVAPIGPGRTIYPAVLASDITRCTLGCAVFLTDITGSALGCTV